MNYLSRALELKEETVEYRRYLHQHPEVGFDLPLTARFVWDKLRDMGYEPARCGKAGITATAGFRPGGKTVLLRADMDALPMREESGLPFAATGDRAHCCGHDMHTAMLLCAARMLKENEDNLPGTVKLMFQPAEELLEGAKDMIDAGILENPRVDAAMGAHMLPLIPTGVIAYNTGAVTPTSDHFEITLHGKGGHGAQPQNAVDPINMGVHLHLALQEILSREVDPQQPAVLTIGAFRGGTAHNVIPETATLQGTVRTFHQETRDFIVARIREMAESTAATFRGRAQVEFLSSTISLYTDPQVAETAAAGMREILGERVAQIDQRAEGSEDFAEVAARVPSLFFVVGAGSPQEGYRYGLHNPKVVFNEEAMPYGAAAYAQGATAWLAAQAAPLGR